MNHIIPTLLVLLSTAGGLVTAAETASPFFPLAGTLAENPYAQAALAKIPGILKAAVPEPGVAGVQQAMPKYTDLKRYADQTQLLVWAWLCPGTPHHQAPAVLAKIVARLDLLSTAQPGGTYFPLYPGKKDNHYNLFLLESFGVSAAALVHGAVAHLPSASVARWKEAMRVGLAYQAENPAGHQLDGEYGVIPNVDLRYLNALAAGIRLLGDVGDYRATSESLLTATEGHLLPDGAFHYFGGENECFSYHESNLRDLARYHVLMGSAKAKELIVRSRNYYPLSIAPGGVIEYTTAPSWKAMWNASGKTVGPQIVAHYADDAVNRGIAREEEARNPGYPEAYLSDLLIGMGCWDAGKPVAEAPDRVILPDANVGGFRARFGRFAVVGDARDHRSQVNPIRSENAARSQMQGRSFGISSRIGATVARADAGRGRLDAALLRVYPAVQFETDKPFWQGAATLADGGPGTAIIAGPRASLSIAYDMGSAKTGPTYVPRPGWRGLEAWHVTEDHLVGYVAVEATADGRAESLTARIALGYGRAGPDLLPKTIQTVSDGLWRYGDLMVRVVHSDFGAVRLDEAAPYFREEAPKATEIILGGGEPVARQPVPAGTRRGAVIEVYPAWAKPAEIAVTTTDGVVALTVAGRSSLRFNSASEPRTIAVPAGAQVHAASGPMAPAPTATIAPGAHVLVVTGKAD
jgi:hypothetical protein